ncbi:MAG TPA: hypothetical protein VN541_14200 [Tepidisphaeraceae bacterium]|nr:hypothetical protein [Tepidisphaeraceae bacterium]
MAQHANNKLAPDERLKLGDGARPLFLIAAVVGVIGIIVAILLGHHSESGFQQFWFCYLAAIVFFLSIAIGCLFFVMMQYLSAAGWSVVVRRVAEAYTAWIPWLGIACIPIIILVAIQNPVLYRWASPMSTASPEAIAAAKASKPEVEEPAHPETSAEATKPSAPEKWGTLDPITLQKRIQFPYWLNPWFFAVRIIGYFAVWTLMARFYRKLSGLQDENGDPNLTRRMQKWAGFHMVVLGLTLTGAAGDLLMSLDPHWYSTMWAVYYFAGCALVSFAVLIITVYLLQRAGYLRSSITTEHYHDLGKYLFGFTFFWGYIAFGQYMLLWYANIPEEIQWFSRHGVTTVSANFTGWCYVMVAILFGQLLIPYAALLTRHTKRVLSVLFFLAIWQLAFHFLDNYWIIMPEFPGKFGASVIITSIAAYAGVGGILLAVLVRTLAGRSLLPVADPRLDVSLAFQNF